MARKRRSPRRSSSRRSSRRSASRRGFTGAPRAKIGDYVLAIGAGAAGAIATQYAIDKWAPKAWQTGDARIATKAAIGLGTFLASRKVRGKTAKTAMQGLSIGAGISSGLDVIARFTAKPAGSAGMGSFTDANPQVRTLGSMEDELAQAARDVGIA